MQTGSEQLRRQQEIMRAKGFYGGKLDGIWGPATVDSKKKWEMSGTFAPGLPNFGLPLSNKGPYPKGVILDKATGMLTCTELELQKQKDADAAAAQAKQATLSKAKPVEDRPSSEE
jgi:hypothetical protein